MINSHMIVGAILAIKCSEKLEEDVSTFYAVTGFVYILVYLYV